MAGIYNLGIADGAEGADDANPAPAPAPAPAPGVNYRRGFWIVAGVAGVAGAIVALPFVIRGVTNILESAVESTVRLGPVVVRLTQPVSNLVGPSIRGIGDGMLRFLRGVPLQGTETLVNSVHVFANGTQAVVAHTAAEAVDLTAIMGPPVFTAARATARVGVRDAVLGYIPNFVLTRLPSSWIAREAIRVVAGVTMQVTRPTILGGARTYVVPVTQAVAGALLRTCREAAAQQTQRLLVVGSEYAVNIGGFLAMHALFLGVRPVRDRLALPANIQPVVAQVIPPQEAVVIGPDIEQLEEQRALDRQPLPIVVQLDQLAARQGAQPVVEPAEHGVGVGAHIDLDAALLRLER